MGSHTKIKTNSRGCAIWKNKVFVNYLLAVIIAQRCLI